MKTTNLALLSLMFTCVHVQTVDFLNIFNFHLQIPAYDHTKHVILNSGLMQEGVPLHVTSSMVAGFCTALTTSPVDVVKTRVMNQCK